MQIIVYSLRLKQLKSICRQRAMLSRFTIKCAKHYAPIWFNCLIVCSFWAKSGKHHSESVGNSCRYEKKGQ